MTGRPKDPNAIRRTGEHLHLLLTPAEKAAYEADAQANGMSLAEYTREALRRMHRSSKPRKPKEPA